MLTLVFRFLHASHAFDILLAGLTATSVTREGLASGAGAKILKPFACEGTILLAA